MDARVFGKYTLLGRLGGGGMAEVFRAQFHGPEGFKKDVALKLILPQFSDDPDFLRMFIREATLAARLDHAKIVRIYEFDQVDGRYFISMEFVDGRDLRQLLTRAREIDRPLSVPQALVVAHEVCQGLAFAHGELTPGAPEVIHRDVSPHNIILSQAGEVKITDFGIAKLATAASVTRTGIIKGKASYMSPEQARGEPVDRRSDLFSLGCVLWEMLSGQKLFTGENDLAVLEHLQRGAIPNPSSFNKAVPPELDGVLASVLQRDPQRRFPSASALGRALDRILLTYPDLDRVASLAGLFREMFSSTTPRSGTAVVSVAADPGSAASEECVEPVGPEAATVKEDQYPTPHEKVETDQPPLRLRMRTVSLAVLVSLGLLLTGLGVYGWKTCDEGWGIGQGPVPESVVTATVPSLQLPILFDEPKSDRTEKKDEGLASPGPNDQTKFPTESGRRERRGMLSTGRLDLNVIPWARVYRGEKFLGETPLEGLILSVGEHELILKNPPLGKTKRVRVKIQAQQTTQQVFDLGD